MSDVQCRVSWFVKRERKNVYCQWCKRRKHPFLLGLYCFDVTRNTCIGRAECSGGTLNAIAPRRGPRKEEPVPLRPTSALLNRFHPPKYHICMVSTFGRVWINRAWLPILLVVS